MQHKRLTTLYWWWRCAWTQRLWALPASIVYYYLSCCNYFYTKLSDKGTTVQPWWTSEHVLGIVASNFSRCIHPFWNYWSAQWWTRRREHKWKQGKQAAIRAMLKDNQLKPLLTTIFQLLQPDFYRDLAKLHHFNSSYWASRPHCLMCRPRWEDLRELVH